MVRSVKVRTLPNSALDTDILSYLSYPFTTKSLFDVFISGTQFRRLSFTTDLTITLSFTSLIYIFQNFL